GSRGYGGSSTLTTSSGRGGYRSSLRSCGPGQADDGTGNCVEAITSSNVFVFSGPNLPVSYGPPPYIPKPKIDYNIVFVRTPEQAGQLDPIIVPPPQQRTIVYVLTKNGQVGQQVIEVPGAPGQAPEVFYVNYNDGDNPTLAGGVQLQDVISQQGQSGQIVSGRARDFGLGGDAGFAFGGGAGGGYSAPAPRNPSYN
ncbi:UNVERIFIED_CONTAM: hypothetical protein GTU68_064653, partial [Idotea baltica]|nr:hypothetical protein [Idotea baltica]